MSTIKDGLNYLNKDEFRKSFEIFYKLSKKKDPISYYYLGIIYSHGLIYNL
jgi:hypothetical protein